GGWGGAHAGRGGPAAGVREGVAGVPAPDLGGRGGGVGEPAAAGGEGRAERPDHGGPGDLPVRAAVRRRSQPTPTPGGSRWHQTALTARPSGASAPRSRS